MVHPKGRTYLFATLKFLYVELGGQRPRLSSLRSPNARNKFAFALGERKLLATLKFLYVELGGRRPQLQVGAGFSLSPRFKIKKWYILTSSHTHILLPPHLPTSPPPQLPTSPTPHLPTHFNSQTLSRHIP
jgi:hypothetical protein